MLTKKTALVVDIRLAGGCLLGELPRPIATLYRVQVGGIGDLPSSAFIDHGDEMGVWTRKRGPIA
jgi:hypothetical protein